MTSSTDDETFELILSDAANALIDPRAGRAMGTIRDDDELPELWIAATRAAEEGGTARFEVTLARPSGRTLFDWIKTIGGTATDGRLRRGTFRRSTLARIARAGD